MLIIGLSVMESLHETMESRSLRAFLRNFPIKGAPTVEAINSIKSPLIMRSSQELFVNSSHSCKTIF